MPELHHLWKNASTATNEARTIPLKARNLAPLFALRAWIYWSSTYTDLICVYNSIGWLPGRAADARLLVPANSTSRGGRGPSGKVQKDILSAVLQNRTALFAEWGQKVCAEP